MPELAAAAAALLTDNRYAVLGTVDDGDPWTTPVWFAHRGLTTLVWLSRPGSRHSRAIAATGRVAVTVFDGHVPPGHGTAFYGRGLAAECPSERMSDLLALYSATAQQQGIGAWARDRVTGEAAFRLYVADLDEVSVLLDDDGPEVRRSVDLG